MKMTVLKVALLAAGLTSGGAYAAFTEGDLAADNSITLEGEITNTNPVWSWQVGDDQMDWDTTKLEWQVTGTNATADFSGKGPIAVLDGYLKNVLPTGAVGVTPVITLSGDGYAVTANAGGVEQTAEINVTGLTDANDPASEVTGKMAFNLVQGAVLAWQSTGGVAKYIRPVTLPNIAVATSSTNSAYTSALNSAFDNMKLSPDFASSDYASMSLDPAATAIWGGTRVLTSKSDYIMFSGVHSDINTAKVTFPAATIPEVWNAALSVTVAYQ